MCPEPETRKDCRDVSFYAALKTLMKVISLSFWDSLEDLLSYERSPVRQELANGLEEFYPALAYAMGDYWVKHFEIISTTRFQPERTLT